ncbi:MAG: GNAT family N-acetyltransferase, partial [Micropepsaceae bacterium]
MSVEIRKPTLNELSAYVGALKRGWGPDNMRAKASADEHLQRIERDPIAFVTSLDDPEAKGSPVTLPDGSTVPRLPGFN